MRRPLTLLAAGLAAGVALATPNAAACDLETCPGTRIVCGVADCTPGIFCEQVGEWLYVCI